MENAALARPSGVAPAIELRGICKSFGSVRANHDISLSIAPGTVHGIVGENGAGKSTLMSILYGFYRADAGEIRIHGQRTAIPNSQAAIRAGIGMVHQHFMLVHNFTVLENVVLGAEDGPLLAPALANARSLLTRLSEEYELSVDPDAIIENLSVGHQQRVEILKALFRQADILILDEPTGVLTPAEAKHLFRILRNLRDEGKCIILITHKLQEILQVTDTVSVMRQGEMTATVKTKDTSADKLAQMMVGRKVLLRVDKTQSNPGDIVLETRKLCVTDAHDVPRLRNVSLSVRRGEILGIAGVAGNGQTELLAAIGGMTPASGEIHINGQKIRLSGSGADPRVRRQLGIAHVPEDRHRHALVMEFHAWENMVLGYHNHRSFRRGSWFMNTFVIRTDSMERMRSFDVRPLLPETIARSFSGGNQQKIVLAREFSRSPDLLIVGQPTRGVDIGAIEFIHQRIVDLRDAGVAVLLVSVELDEILSLADRVAVMFDGSIIGERDIKDTDENELGLLMAGIAGGPG